MRQEITIPFEKNKYFYGKLLSVEDFELEQRYGEDKRRLMNRLLYGSGVVTGLYVAAVDEFSVSIEKGVAIDTSGREIVLNTAVMKKLSDLDGFEECMRQEEEKAVYLCLEYKETPTVPVHNVTKNVPSAELAPETDYSRVREDYRLFLTDREPAGENLSSTALFEEVITVCRGNGIRIKQRLPRYVQAGESCELLVEVENRDRRNLAFQYDLKLNGMTWEGLSTVRVMFDEVLYERTGFYQVRFRLTAAEGVEGNGSASVVAGSMKLLLSSELQTARAEGSMEFQIGSRDRKEALLQQYYRLTMEEVLKEKENNPLYLARLFLLRAEDSYMIEELRWVPFGQFVRNMMLEQALDTMLAENAGTGTENSKKPGEEPSGRHQDTNKGVLIRGGVSLLKLREGAQKGEVYYSEEISHGLGLGKTVIQLGLQDGDDAYYGNCSIFESKRLDILLGAKVNREKGTFVIGAKIGSAVTETELQIQWTAFRDSRDTVLEQAEMRIFIKPNVLELRVRESRQLEAICENMPKKAVLWSVSPEGGTVDNSGLYTAPSVPGVYEVVACGAAYPEIKASLFVVVRDYIPEGGRTV